MVPVVVVVCMYTCMCVYMSVGVLGEDVAAMSVCVGIWKMGVEDSD